MMAQNVINERTVRREKRKQFVDKMAAILILQYYLDAHAH
ncbi:RuvX/YqgF family protein [Megasphaera massiliensis]|uniref:RuvX/YqgF family protein n=1 Tax=Megasphaera massiliensis TaxID=1232428 RepID=A0ABT1SVH7_9FIRM|nr:RuvX/YqgF family protein [Megasphaera massiliensis]